MNWNLCDMWRPAWEAAKVTWILAFPSLSGWLCSIHLAVYVCVCSTHINQNWSTALKHLLVLQSLKSHAVAMFYFSESFQDLVQVCAFSCLLGRANCGKPVTVPSTPLCIDPMSARTLANVLWRILLKWLKTLLGLSECPALLLLLAFFQWMVSSEHFTFGGDFLENLAYALGQLRHNHVVLLCPPQDQ